ncbi:MAG: class I SAM-dependent methyltransferase [Candidatus Binatia bacterium]
MTFIEQVPQDLGRFYVNEQYDIPPPDRNGFQPRAESQLWKVDLLKTLISPGSLFEVGPATGEFAFVARQAGFRLKLAEMDEQCCRFLRDVLDLDVVHTSDPAGCLTSEDHYDAICIWQAIEHIPEFWKLMDRAADRLASGGVMVVSTPNPRSIQARILGRYWPHTDVPRHLYLIPQKWFRSFARKRGLSVVLDTTRDVGSIGLNYYGWYLAVRNFTRGILADRRVHTVARWITTLLRRREEAEGAGCSYTIALRRN